MSIARAEYFAAMAQARFDDAYILTKMTAVAHMTEPTWLLFMPDVLARMLCWWLMTLLMP